MKINIKKCLDFLDNTPIRGHTTAIVGMIDEELGACAFKHFIEYGKKRNKTEVKILLNKETGVPLMVTSGRKKGKRLDRWIEVKENGKVSLYQCEIKFWSATAIGGQYLELKADVEEVKRVAERHWERQLATQFSDRIYPNGVTKVFEKMRTPDEYSKKVSIRPLLIYWMPVSNHNNTEPFFEVPVSIFNNRAIKTDFKKLKIFSVSLYFRKLQNDGINIINLDMPNSQYRMKILKNIGIM